MIATTGSADVYCTRCGGELQDKWDRRDLGTIGTGDILACTCGVTIVATGPQFDEPCQDAVTTVGARDLCSDGWRVLRSAGIRIMAPRRVSRRKPPPRNRARSRPGGKWAARRAA